MCAWGLRDSGADDEDEEDEDAVAAPLAVFLGFLCGSRAVPASAGNVPVVAELEEGLLLLWSRSPSEGWRAPGTSLTRRGRYHPRVHGFIL